MNKCLMSNQEVYQKKLHSLEESLNKSNQEKEAEIQDLRSQLKDIMFYLDAQSKFNESKDVTREELQDSHMIITSDSPSANSNNAAAGASSSPSAAGASASADKNRRKKKK